LTSFQQLDGTDPGQDYFCDGITEEITSALSRIPGLTVIDRHSSFAYKDRPAGVTDIAGELGAQYILEGSVRKSDDRARITSQLIDAATEHHLWAERFDRDLDDVLVIQDEIAHAVAVALQVKLVTGEVARQWAARTHSRKAWECVILGREYFYRNSEAGNAEARRLFETRWKSIPIT
jgi:adenylate cyclase